DLSIIAWARSLVASLACAKEASAVNVTIANNRIFFIMNLARSIDDRVAAQLQGGNLCNLCNLNSTPTPVVVGQAPPYGIDAGSWSGLTSWMCKSAKMARCCPLSLARYQKTIFCASPSVALGS